MSLKRALFTTLVGVALTLSAGAQPLKPLPGKNVSAPASAVKVLMTTDAGDLEIEIYPYLTKTQNCFHLLPLF